MDTVFEVIKYILPAIIVFVTAYFLIKKLVDSQYHLKALELKSKYSKEAIPLKLQAYERLILFCDRIDIPSLILRLKTPKMTSIELKNTMIISVQKEFEHNIAQQLYTSNQLWHIIQLAKNDVIAFIETHSFGISPESPANTLAQHLLEEAGKQKKGPVKIALDAIKEEAKIILNV